jgi:cytoskeleton protein RodZ
MTEQATDNILPQTEPRNPQEQPVQQFLLRQARERVGLHLAAVAVTLKVPVARLEALEAGRYHELPDPTFVRALAKSVCKVLKVDPEPILATLPSAYVADLGPTSTAISTPMPTRRAGAIMTSGESMLHVPLAVLVAVVLAVLALVLWMWLPERPMADSLQPEPALTSSQSDRDSQGSKEPASPEASNTSVPMLAAADVMTQVTESVAPIVAVMPTEGPQVAQGIVQLIAADTTWIQVVGASQRVLLQRSLEAHESVAFSNDFPLSVVIGRADQVTVRVRDQAFDLVPWTRGNVARFEVQ